MKAKPRILYSSAEVREAVAGLFRDARAQRIAISAFVGDGAEAYLPSPNGLRIICSPTPGATNPNALRRLIKRGATVEFVDRLHMKVYWAKQKGAVITSANLSTNAMGIGGLREAGVFLGSDALDIRRLLRPLRPRLALPELRTLDRKHKDYVRRVRGSGKRTPAETYSDWHNSPAREEWKVFFFSRFFNDLSRTSLESVKQEFGVRPHDWLWSRRRIQETDWVLCVHTGRGRWGLEWLFADRIFQVPKSERNFDTEFPYEVIQVGPMKWYTSPPFAISASFRNAFRAAFGNKIPDESPSPEPPNDKLLRRIFEKLKARKS